ncbi:hypothetical protein [Arthrobacter castelli]|uniref:hypothetical protein n=1 Tax=Arthrobacter castelli TaxID=271431 RepID=UPI00138AB6BF|nr:hypothetical protein [Arthrobacter castelli]
MIRIELDSDRERAKKFHQKVTSGAPFPKERELVVEGAWARGFTPTGTVHYRGISNGQPPGLKFDVEVAIDHEEHQH